MLGKKTGEAPKRKGTHKREHPGGFGTVAMGKLKENGRKPSLGMETPLVRKHREAVAKKRGGSSWQKRGKCVHLTKKRDLG